MNVYEQQKQKLTEKKVASVNPQAALQRATLLPRNKPLSGRTGVGPQPTQEVPEYQQGAFYKQKRSHMQNPHFMEGVNQLEQLAHALRRKVEDKEMPSSIAQKHFKMAVDTFAGNSREYQQNLKAQGKDNADKLKGVAGKLHTGGQELSSQILAAQHGDKDAQRELRDINFDWTKPQATKVINNYGVPEDASEEFGRPKVGKLKAADRDPVAIDDTGMEVSNEEEM